MNLLVKALEDFEESVGANDVLNSKFCSKEVDFEVSDEEVSRCSSSESSKLKTRLAVKHNFIAKKTRTINYIWFIRSTAWSVSGAFIRLTARYT